MSWEGLSPPYGTIVIDPPWRYERDTGLDGLVSDQYSTLSNEDIAALPVGGLAARDAHCYLWVTNPRMFGAKPGDRPAPVEILAAWGFEYRTLLTWVKTGPLGMGWYFRGQTEHVLFGTRGSGGIEAEKRRPNVITAARGRHSAKPAAFGDLVEACSPGPYVELFARQPRLGWDAWGYGFESAPTARPVTDAPASLLQGGSMGQNLGGRTDDTDTGP